MAKMFLLVHWVSFIKHLIPAAWGAIGFWRSRGGLVYENKNNCGEWAAKTTACLVIPGQSSDLPIHWDCTWQELSCLFDNSIRTKFRISSLALGLVSFFRMQFCCVSLDFFVFFIKLNICRFYIALSTDASVNQDAGLPDPTERSTLLYNCSLSSTNG